MRNWRATPQPQGRRRSFVVMLGVVAALIGAGAVVAAMFASGASANAGARRALSHGARTLQRGARTPADGTRAAGRSATRSGKAFGSASSADTNSRRVTPARQNVHARPAALRTSCRTVAHIGDSTSVDLISPAFLPDPAQRLQAQYGRVGVNHLNMDASGGRSIVEAMPGQVNGYNVASAWRAQSFHGCWVFALGTNDTANVAVGSAVGLAARIDEMMSVAHGQPVMWVNALTQLTSGYWSNANEQAWDQALVQALHKYPNMRIYDWAAVAQPGWFLPDGIHYNSLGCAQRASAIADALARAFPLGGHSVGQIVR